MSVWVEILLDKYLYAQATHRLLSDFAHLGCPLSQGTVTGGLQRLAPLFEPVVDALRDKHLSERLFHADETGWKVFEAIENKASNRWYLWVTQSPSVVYYLMAPGRDAGVPLDHFSELEEGQFPVFVVCDRYSCLQKTGERTPDHCPRILLGSRETRFPRRGPPMARSERLDVRVGRGDR